MLNRIEPEPRPALAAGTDAARRLELERAARDFEAQLMTFLVRSMRQAFAEERDGVAEQYLDLGDAAIARGLVESSGGPGLADDLLERVRELAAPAAASPPPPLPAPAALAPRSPRAPAAVRSAFGSRPDPLTGEPAFHRGIDLAARRGDPVAAAADGVVVRAAESKGFGRHVVVRHPGGYETVYAHLDRLDVAQGDEVRAGSTVGRAGSTGRSTGPHLHFEVRRSGQTVDPLEVLGRGRPDWRWPVAAASGASHDVG